MNVINATTTTCACNKTYYRMCMYSMPTYVNVINATTLYVKHDTYPSIVAHVVKTTTTACSKDYYYCM